MGIINDDGGTGVTDTRSELTHGYRTVRALTRRNASNSHLYWIQTEPASSYEVVVDAGSGDIGNGNGPSVQRLSSDGGHGARLGRCRSAPAPRAACAGRRPAPER